MSQKNSDEKNIGISIIYRPKIKNTKDVRIFGNKFVQNNKDKAKILFNGLEKDLSEFFEDIIPNYDHQTEIRLKLLISRDIIDVSYMFDECEALHSFPDDEINEESLNDFYLTNSIESKVQLTNNEIV